MPRFLTNAAVLAVSLAVAVPAQEPIIRATDSASDRPEFADEAAPTPFGVGEQARYRVGYGILRAVGSGSMHIVGVDTVDGHPVYHMHFRLRGGIPGARVNNTYDSWMDVNGLFSRRFEQDTKEVRFTRKRLRNFFPEQRTWTGFTNDRTESGTLETSAPLDDTSFLYFVRTLPLEPGDEYEFNNYWNPDGNPVRIRVLRRETVEVPAGRFNTVVVQPLIETSGMFSDGGEAEVYFTDDAARILIMLRAKVAFGSLRLELEEFTPGRPLSTAAFVPSMPR